MPIERNIYVLIVCFGIASWIGVNGVWVELPVLVEKLPEGWALPSYLTIVISLGNVLPMLLIIQQKRKKAADRRLDSVNYLSTVEEFSHVPHEFTIVLSVLAMQLVACLFLIFTWNTTSSSHSIALFFLVFLVSMADCSSSIFFIPYLAHFPPLYLTAYYTGGGLSGLIPGLISLGQGVSSPPKCANVTSIDPFSNTTTSALQPVYGEPRFSPDFFFLALALMTVVSLTAFLVLHLYYLPKIRQSSTEERESFLVSYSGLSDTLLGLKEDKSIHDTDNYLQDDSNGEPEMPSGFLPQSGTHLVSKKEMSRRNSFYLIFLNFVLNFMANGVLPSIQSYSCIPYGDQYYHLSVSISSAANTLTCLGLLRWGTSNQTRWLERHNGAGWLTLILLLFSIYIITAASQSPEPFLSGTAAGGVMIVLVWVSINGLFTYIKVMIAGILSSRRGYDALLWYGVMTQVGSTCGSLLMFPLVNVYNKFQTKVFSCGNS